MSRGQFFVSATRFRPMTHDEIWPSDMSLQHVPATGRSVWPNLKCLHNYKFSARNFKRTPIESDASKKRWLILATNMIDPLSRQLPDDRFLAWNTVYSDVEKERCSRVQKRTRSGPNKLSQWFTIWLYKNKNNFWKNNAEVVYNNTIRNV